MKLAILHHRCDSQKIHLCRHRQGVKTKNSATGTRTLVSCVRGKYDNHLHHGGQDCTSRESNSGPNDGNVGFYH
eukprot:scaffold51490_cov40-Cyclotella_meneghiniana.AAC.3